MKAFGYFGRALALAAMLGLGGGVLSACEEEGPAEEAGEGIDETMEDAADGAEEAADDAEDAADDAMN